MQKQNVTAEDMPAFFHIYHEATKCALAVGGAANMSAGAVELMPAHYFTDKGSINAGSWVARTTDNSYGKPDAQGNV
ncbi:MAG: hypothetical protein KGI75_21420 [Rhizobiaceae bacterium]|nr:hypothetical protein [Rhizobiaceae bacterium]